MHKTTSSLTLQPFIEVPAPSQQSQTGHVYVRGINFAPFSTIFLFDSETVLTVCDFFVFHLINFTLMMNSISIIFSSTT